MTSTPSWEKPSGSLPAACTASQWTRAPWRRASAATSATGWITPVSLLASITETKAGRTVARCRSSCCQIEPALGIDRQALGMRCRRQHRIMLDGGDQDRPVGTADRLVVGLGAAAREHHRRGRRADQSAHRYAGFLQGAPRGAAGLVHRGRVAERGERAGDRLDHRRPDRRGRVVVEIAERRATRYGRRPWPAAYDAAMRRSSSGTGRPACAPCCSSSAIRAVSSSRRSLSRSITRATGSTAAPGAVP